jgi:hypothetical protein
MRPLPTSHDEAVLYVLEGALGRFRHGGAKDDAIFPCSAGRWCWRCLIAEAKGHMDESGEEWPDAVLVDARMIAAGEERQVAGDLVSQKACGEILRAAIARVERALQL